MRKTALAAAIGALATSIPATQAAAQSATVVGLDDFGIKNVGEGLFGATRRDATDSRFQVNGSNPDSSNRNFGLWATFDIATNGIFAAPITTLESVTVDLFQAQPITGQDIDNIITGGDLEVFVTFDDRDVLDSANGFIWDTTSPNGLGDQFNGLFPVNTIALADGNTDASISVDTGAFEQQLIDELNDPNGFVRFVFTSSTMDLASSWGVGEPGTSTILAFDGRAPEVTFAVPAPGAAAIAVLGMIATRRRR